MRKSSATESLVPEDIPEFAGKIRLEAARLLSLIEDIIKLSRLRTKTS